MDKTPKKSSAKEDIIGFDFRIKELCSQPPKFHHRCAYYFLDLDSLERIWTTSLFRLRSISSVPLSRQSGHILKSCIKPSWKTNLHGYTALTISPQQSQNKCFMFSSYTHLNWRIRNLKKKVSRAKIVANLKCLRRQIYCDLRNKHVCARSIESD